MPQNKEIRQIQISLEPFEAEPLPGQTATRRYVVGYLRADGRGGSIELRTSMADMPLHELLANAEKVIAEHTNHF